MPASGAVNVTAGTLGDRAEVLGAAALILAQSPRVLARPRRLAPPSNGGHRGRLMIGPPASLTACPGSN